MRAVPFALAPRYRVVDAQASCVAEYDCAYRAVAALRAAMARGDLQARGWRVLGAGDREIATAQDAFD